MSSTLDILVPNCPPDAKQLMRSLLHFNPDKRSTADHGCKSKYCARFANQASEITLIHDVMPPLSDNIQLSASEYRVKLYEVCCRQFLLKYSFSIISAKFRVDH